MGLSKIWRHLRKLPIAVTELVIHVAVRVASLLAVVAVRAGWNSVHHEAHVGFRPVVGIKLIGVPTNRRTKLQVSGQSERLERKIS